MTLSPIQKPAWIAAAFSIAAAVALHGALPSFTNTKPSGVQRGVDTKITITGDRLADFEGFIFYSPGFKLKSVEKAEKNKVEATLSVAADVPLGGHWWRVRTKSGVSFMRQIMVGPYPSMEEKEPNNDFEIPQPVGFNQTIEGVAGNEDVDYFKLSAKKGQRISLEAEGMRLGNVAFDPFVAVFDSRRFEIASSDDTVLHRQDGYLSVVAPADGDYIIQVRESSYRGTGNSYYRLHVGSFRRPDVCYPAGGKVGTTRKFKFIERNGEAVEQEVKLPAEPDNQFLTYVGSDPAPSGNMLRVSPFDDYTEQEPNDDFAHANASGLAAPCAFNGIIEKAGDTDQFKFKLAKGQKVDFRAYAQIIGSPLDSIIYVFNAKGQNVGSNDDGGGYRRMDSKFSYTAPADGEYGISITDHLGRGGPNYVYRIEAVASLPEVTFSSPNFSVNDSHMRQFIAVPRGNRYATMVNINRVNASGDMTLSLPKLPAGIKLLTPKIPANQTSCTLLFEADPNAPLAGEAVTPELKPVDPSVPVTGRLAQSFDIVRAGNTIYYVEQVDQLPVAVVEEVPFTLELEKPAVPLVANGQLALKVKATRKEGFKSPIRVLMIWRPPGVNSQGEVDIPEGQTEATFQLDSTAGITPGTYPLTVLGESQAGNGTMYAASPYCDLTLAPAYLSGTVPLTVTEQGGTGDLVCKLEHAAPFEGEATAQILGAPEGVTVEPAKITKDSKEVTFKFTSTPAVAAGKHGTLFCQVQVPVAGGVATHRIAGGTTLRIDPARKAPAPAAAPAPGQVAANKPAAPAGEPKKQLSRLEQLRLEAANK